MTSESNILVWSGKQTFRLVSTDRYTDSLRIKTALKGSEIPLRLILPTLCITYADMRFANAIGGEQENYPASQAYGPTYFDPPVELNGESEVRKFTWIRGAHRVVIGAKDTVIEWYPWKMLIIPRLRLDKKTPATAILSVKDVPISLEQPLVIKVLQYADGRHVGGIRVEKRHPEWIPPEKSREYDLWVRVVDAVKRVPIPEARLNLFRWDPKMTTPYGQGGLNLVDQCYTNSDGVYHDKNRPSGELEAVALYLPGWRAVARCFRPLEGQHVRLYIRAWPLKPTTLPYIWRHDDSLEHIEHLTGHKARNILKDNGLSDPSDLKPGIGISLPCYSATYRMEPGDTFEWLSEAFGYESVKEVSKLNGMRDLSSWDGSSDIVLPGWYFFYAPPNASLERIDEQFGLSKGSVRTVGRVHHADSRLPYEGETIAIPTVSRTITIKKHR
jgi:hypothetical protein